MVDSLTLIIYRQYLPSKHAGCDSEAFWLWQVLDSAQQKLGQVTYAGSDFLHPIQVCSSREGLDHIVQNRPGSDLDGLVRFWPNASGSKQVGVQES